MRTAFLALLLLPSAASSASLIFGNSDMPPIPLEERALYFDDAGRLSINCHLTGGNCQMEGQAVGPRPIVNLSSPLGSTVHLEDGGYLTLQWNTANGVDICLARSSTTLPGWEGQLGPSGTKGVQFSTPGNYSLALECYNSAGSTTSSALAVQVQADDTGPGPGDPPDPDGCSITSNDPLFQPPGFTRYELTWEEAFFGQSFPNISNGGLSPVGSFSFRTQANPTGMPMTGKYISIPFVVSGSNQNFKTGWYRSQAIYSRGYYDNRPADLVFVTISPCAGDFRLPDYAAPLGTLLSPSCRQLDQNANMFYGTTAGAPQCQVTPGQVHYINIVFADPRGGLFPNETGCDQGEHCNANFKH